MLADFLDEVLIHIYKAFKSLPKISFPALLVTNERESTPAWLQF